MQPSTLGILGLQAAALAYLAAGKLGFEPRLALGPLSANQIVQVIVLVAGAIAAVRIGRGAAPRHVAVALVGMLTFLLAAGLWQTVNRGYAMDKILGHALVVLPALFVLSYWTRDARDARRALAIWACAGGFMMLVGLALLATGRNPERLAVLGGGANVFARMVGSAAIAALGVWGLELRGRRGVVEVALLAGTATVLLYAGSKAPIVVLGMAIALWALYLGRKRRALACVIAVGALAATPMIIHRFVEHAPKDKGEVRMFQQPDLADPAGSYTTRLQFARESAALLRDRGLFGVGTGDWGPAVGRAPGRAYPHNVVLELWSELGLAGVAFMALVVGWTIRLVRRARRQGAPPRMVATALALTVFWIANALASGDLLDNRNVWWSLLLLEIAGTSASVRAQIDPLEVERVTREAV